MLRGTLQFPRDRSCTAPNGWNCRCLIRCVRARIFYIFLWNIFQLHNVLCSRAAAESFETIFIMFVLHDIICTLELVLSPPPEPKISKWALQYEKCSTEKKTAEEHFQYFFYVELISIVSGHIARRRRQCWAMEGSWMNHNFFVSWKRATFFAVQRRWRRSRRLDSTRADLSTPIRTDHCRQISAVFRFHSSSRLARGRLYWMKTKQVESRLACVCHQRNQNTTTERKIIVRRCRVRERESGCLAKAAKWKSQLSHLIHTERANEDVCSGCLKN